MKWNVNVIRQDDEKRIYVCKKEEEIMIKEFPLCCYDKVLILKKKSERMQKE